MNRGKFIVIEGIDGSGKATQAKLLVKNLRLAGKKAELVSFPRYNKESSVLIREYLDGKFGGAEKVDPYKASVFYAIDRYAESFRLRKLLDDGCYVIGDRYVSSNKGHQASKINNRKERLKYLMWLNEFEYEIMGIPVPDKTIYLELGAMIAHDNVVSRASNTGQKIDIHDNLKHLKKAEKTYKEMIQIDPYENWVEVKVSQSGKMRSIKDIQSDIIKVI